MKENTPRFVEALEITVMGYAKIYKNHKHNKKYITKLDRHVEDLIKDLIPEKKYQDHLQQYYNRVKHG